jgi:hypothetical protein
LERIRVIYDRIVLRSAFQRACYHFSMRALWRSETHSIVLGAFVGLGIVLASQMAIDAPPAPHPGRAAPDPLPSADLIAATLAVAYCLVVGLRFVFEIPAGVNGNWLYRLILGNGEQETATAAKKIMLTFLVPGVIAPSLIAFSWAWGWRVGVLHAVNMLVASAILINIVLSRFRKIPFTCTLPAFQNHAIMLVLVYILGFFFFTGIAAALEREMLQQPLLFLALPVLFGLCHDVLRRMKRDTPDIDLRLRFEEEVAKEVQTLNIG